jgi:hypothetical protein
VAQFEPFYNGSVPCLFFDRVKSTHHLDRLARDFGSGLFRFDHFATQVCPAARTRDLVAGHHAVVPAVGVSQQNLPVILQKILRSVATSMQREVEDVVRMGMVAHVDPHPRIGCLALAQHGHDRVVGGHHMRSSYMLGHQLIQHLDQIGHIAAPNRLRGARDLEDLEYLEAQFYTLATAGVLINDASIGLSIDSGDGSVKGGTVTTKIWIAPLSAGSQILEHQQPLDTSVSKAGSDCRISRQRIMDGEDDG